MKLLLILTSLTLISCSSYEKTHKDLQMNNGVTSLYTIFKSEFPSIKEAKKYYIAKNNAFCIKHKYKKFKVLMFNETIQQEAHYRYEVISAQGQCIK